MNYQNDLPKTIALFSVNENALSVPDMLEYAGTLLESAREIANLTVETPNSLQSYATLFMVDMTRLVIDVAAKQMLSS